MARDTRFCHVHAMAKKRVNWGKAQVKDDASRSESLGRRADAAVLDLTLENIVREPVKDPACTLEDLRALAASRGRT